jgi:hypothetical protein
MILAKLVDAVLWRSLTPDPRGETIMTQPEQLEFQWSEEPGRAGREAHRTPLARANATTAIAPLRQRYALAAN